jgi:hypothetical protein
VRSKLVVEGVGEGINAVAVEVDDRDLEATYGVREGFLDRKSVTAFIDLRREGQAALAQLATEATAFTITVSTHVWRPFVDYGLGDSVGVSLPHIGVEGRYRIVAISATPADGGGLDTVELDLDSAAYDAFTRVAKAQQSSQQSFSASQRFPQGSVTLYQVNQEGDVDGGTPFAFRFWVPSTPVYTNQVRLAWEGLPFRAPVRVGTTTVGSAPAGRLQSATGAPSSLPTGETSPAGGQPGPVNPIANHTHEYRELPHQHPFEVPDHAHQVTVPSIEYGLFVGTAPSGVKVVVNGVALDPALYPYTDGGAEDLEIGRFIKRGWNTVTFTSQILGRINASVVIQAYLSAQLEDLSS